MSLEGQKKAPVVCTSRGFEVFYRDALDNPFDLRIFIRFLNDWLGLFDGDVEV